MHFRETLSTVPFYTIKNMSCVLRCLFGPNLWFRWPSDSGPSWNNVADPAFFFFKTLVWVYQNYEHWKYVGFLWLVKNHKNPAKRLSLALLFKRLNSLVLGWGNNRLGCSCPVLCSCIAVKISKWISKVKRSDAKLTEVLCLLGKLKDPSCNAKLTNWTCWKEFQNATPDDVQNCRWKKLFIIGCCN